MPGESLHAAGTTQHRAGRRTAHEVIAPAPPCTVTSPGLGGDRVRPAAAEDGIGTMRADLVRSGAGNDRLAAGLGQQLLRPGAGGRHACRRNPRPAGRHCRRP